MVIKNLSDAALRDHYWSLRELAYNAAQVKSTGLGKLLRELDITVAVARRRGVRLDRATVACTCVDAEPEWDNFTPHVRTCPMYRGAR